MTTSWLVPVVALGALACGPSVHVTASLDVLVHDTSAAAVSGATVFFHSAKWSDGEEQSRTVFDLSKTTGSDGHAIFTVGYNVKASEDIKLDAWSGNGTNRRSETILGADAHSDAAGTDLAVVYRGTVLTSCPTKTPDYCGSGCTDRTYDAKNCGSCGHACRVDCLEGSCVECSNADGTWTTQGDCPVKSCTLSQDTCGGTVVCTEPDNSTTAPTAATVGDGTLTFGATLGTCNITLTGNTFHGECGNDLVSCTVTGTRTR